MNERILFSPAGQSEDSRIGGRYFYTEKSGFGSIVADAENQTLTIVTEKLPEVTLSGSVLNESWEQQVLARSDEVDQGQKLSEAAIRLAINS